MINRPLIPTFPLFFQLLPFRCESLIPLNMGTEKIFPGRVLKFGRHFERRKKFQFLHARSWPFTRVRVALLAQFFLKIDFWYNTWGKAHKSKWHLRFRSPSLIVAPGVTSPAVIVGSPVVLWSSRRLECRRLGIVSSPGNHIFT